MAEQDRPIRFRLWLMLSVAFAILGCLGVYAIYRIALQSGAAPDSLRSALLVISSVVVGLGALMAFVLSSYVLPSATPRDATALPVHVVRSSVLEMLFIGICALVVISAGVGMAMQEDAERSALKSLSRVRYLEMLRSQLVASVASGPPTESVEQHIAKLAQSAELTWSPSKHPISTFDLVQLAKISEQELNAESASFTSLRDAVEKKNQGLLTIFGLAAFLSAGAIVLLRISKRQEGELAMARLEAARQQATYEQIFDHLPIGFFTYSSGAFETCNAALDRLVHREESETPWSAFVRSLHPEDRERVLETFALAERDKGAFGLAHRLAGADGNLRQVETRGVSVHDDHGPDHIVGFVVDISSRVRSQRILEEKNKEVEATNNRLRGALAEIESNFEAMVHSLVKAVEAKDPYTAGHSERVMAYSLKIGARMGIDEEEMRILKMGTLVHDIGKIGIPDAVLTKPARLTDDEYELIKQHPLLGYRMIQHIPTFAECLPIVLHHHERLDGLGYPHGLKGLEIPLLVRITTVADCFDAMTSDRAYRKGLDPKVAVEELYLSADRKMVDRHVVGVLEEIIEEQGIIYGATSAVAT
jgi:PAS domain S-box-containing protein